MNKKQLMLIVGFVVAAMILPNAWADDTSTNTSSQTFYTNAGAFLATASMSQDNGTGGSTSTSLTMAGAGGSYGFDNLFTGGKYLYTFGSVTAGSDSGGDFSFSGVGAGVGGHAEFEPAWGDVDVGAISVYAAVFETYNYLNFNTTVQGQSYSSSSSSSNGAIEYGAKWMILNVYEFDFFGINGSSSSSSGQNSPIGGNSLNLQFKWILQPQHNSAYLGAGYQHQSQSGSSSNVYMILGGYIW